ncbi:hypothetical protein, partial [Stenotrophomonas maltophilia]|uniref:hypothetical protein n=1 Tax=Stenotrophomonas maltophilia TaxID=40324 RepID=UPI0019542D97
TSAGFSDVVFMAKSRGVGVEKRSAAASGDAAACGGVYGPLHSTSSTLCIPENAKTLFGQ